MTNICNCEQEAANAEYSIAFGSAYDKTKAAQEGLTLEEYYAIKDANFGGFSIHNSYCLAPCPVHSPYNAYKR